MAGNVNDVAQLWPESLHLEPKTLAVRKTLLLKFEYRQLIQVFFFIILNYLFPVRVQSLEGLIWTSGKSHWASTFREQQVLCREVTLHTPPLVAMLRFQLECLEPGGSAFCIHTLCND